MREASHLEATHLVVLDGNDALHGDAGGLLLHGTASLAAQSRCYDVLAVVLQGNQGRIAAFACARVTSLYGLNQLASLAELGVWIFH